MFSERPITNKQIILVGVDHVFQWNDELPKADELTEYLIKITNKIPIDLIGEEFSIDAFPVNIKTTVPQKIAIKHNINHRFCDPDEQIRDKIGYPTQVQMRNKFGIKSAHEGTEEHRVRREYEKGFWHIREKYWLDQINDGISKNIIFICGYSHLKSFESLLKEKGYIVTAKII